MKRFVLILLLFGSELFSQGIRVFDLNTDGWPVIRAKFYLFDQNWQRLYNLHISDFQVLEYGETRRVINVTCPEPKQPRTLSSVLVTDISGSMLGTNFDLVKAGAKAWIDALPDGMSECALTAFDGQNFIVQDFTTDRKKIIDGIDDLDIGLSTDYDAAFLDPPAGGLLVAKTGKYEKIIILITDGWPNTNPHVNAIIDYANNAGIRIYSVVLGNTCPLCLKKITEGTQGQWYDRITTIEEIEEVYSTILHEAQNNEPCTIEWEGGKYCSKGQIPVEISYIPYGLRSDHWYQGTRTMLNVDPFYISFKNVKPGVQMDTAIVVTSWADGCVITDIVSSNPAFSVSPKNCTLDSGDFIQLKLTFVPPDSNSQYTTIEVINNFCDLKVNAYGLINGKKPAGSTIKLTHPNGGEFFAVDGDTVITWEGALIDDVVTLSYSTDKGANWQTITDSATGLNYVWKNIPPPPSKKCLAKVELKNENSSLIQWKKCIGGVNIENCTDMKQTSDGGYIIAAYSSNSDGDVPGNYGRVDYYIIKLNTLGDIEWAKNFGGSQVDVPCSVIELADGNFVIAGYSDSEDGEVSENSGKDDAWIIKVSRTGELLWERSFGGRLTDYAYSVTSTFDGGLVFAGTGINTTDVLSEYYWRQAIWVVKLNASGNKIWEKFYGGQDYNSAKCVIETNDGDLVIAGASQSDSLNNTYIDFYLLKLNFEGEKLWQNFYGGSSTDFANSLIEISDGSFVAAGYTYSNDSYINGFHGESDCWIINVDKDGKLLWNRAMGGKEYDVCKSLSSTSDGGFLVAARTSSTDGDVHGNKGGSDYWAVKCNAFGDVEWQGAFGGGEDDYCVNALETDDGGIILGGTTYSIDGDVTGNHGADDIWIVKLFARGLNMWDASDSLWAIVKPEMKSMDVDMGKVLVGATKDSVVKGFILNSGEYPVEIYDITFEGNNAKRFSFTYNNFPCTLEPGKSIPVLFSFSPGTEGKKNADIVVIGRFDTLRMKITGEGVLPVLEVMNSVIDFGKVEVGRSKDSLQVVTIKNGGKVPFEITNTKHAKPNDTDFSTLAGGGSFTLQPGDTAKMDLRFSPGSVGRTSGFLKFYYNGFGSPASVQLFGEGTKMKPGIKTEATGFDDLVCENKSENKISLTNTGKAGLTITAMDMTGTDAGDFTVSTALPITVMPDSTLTVPVVFTSSVPGSKSAVLVVRSDADPDSVLSIPLSARKDSVALIPQATLIDLGTLCPNETKDTNLAIVNYGTIKTGASLGITSYLSAPGGFVVDSGTTGQLQFTFTGSSAEGRIDEKIVLTDTVCGRRTEVQITGEVIAPDVTVEDVTIKAAIGSANDGYFTIKNNSKVGITIDNPVVIPPPFTVFGTPFPVYIEPGKQVYIIVRYTPDDKLEDSLTLSLTGLPCNGTYPVAIRGVPVEAAALFRVSDIEAYPGEEVTAKVEMVSRQYLSFTSLKEIDLNLGYNATLLAPLDLTPRFISPDSAYISLKYYVDTTLGGYSPAKVRFIAGLGNAPDCGLVLSNAEPVENVNLTLESGKFRLLGICPDGGERLVNPNASAGILSVRPNPSDGMVSIGLSLTESGQTRLYISDILGSESKVLMSEQVNSYGVREVRSDISALPAGVYFIILETPTVRQSVCLIKN